MTAAVIAFPARRWSHPRWPPDLWRKMLEEEGSADRAEWMLELVLDVAATCGVKTRLDLPHSPMPPCKLRLV